MDDLVSAAKTDREAFGSLFDHFYPSILAFCVRRLLVRATAEDVASDVFLKVARGIRTFHGSTEEDFRRWLYRIATNEINAHLRQSIRRRELLIAAARVGRIDADISTQLLDREAVADWEAVYRAMEQLTERENKIVSLRFFGELKHDEIASVLEAKPGTIRVALSRALEKMRGLLLKSLDESVATKSSKLGNEQ